MLVHQHVLPSFSQMNFEVVPLCWTRDTWDSQGSKGFMTSACGVERYLLAAGCSSTGAKHKSAPACDFPLVYSWQKNSTAVSIYGAQSMSPLDGTALLQLMQ